MAATDEGLPAVAAARAALEVAVAAVVAEMASCSAGVAMEAVLRAAAVRELVMEAVAVGRVAVSEGRSRSAALQSRWLSAACLGWRPAWTASSKGSWRRPAPWQDPLCPC